MGLNGVTGSGYSKLAGMLLEAGAGGKKAWARRVLFSSFVTASLSEPSAFLT